MGYSLVTCGKAARIDAELIQSEDCEDAMKTQRSLRPHTQSGKMPGRGRTAYNHVSQMLTYTEFGNIRLVRKTLKTLRTLKTLKNIKMLRT